MRGSGGSGVAEMRTKRRPKRGVGPIERRDDGNGELLQWHIPSWHHAASLFFYYFSLNLCFFLIQSHTEERLTTPPLPSQWLVEQQLCSIRLSLVSERQRTLTAAARSSDRLYADRLFLSILLFRLLQSAASEWRALELQAPSVSLYTCTLWWLLLFTIPILGPELQKIWS